jgi:hypothetical protein
VLGPWHTPACKMCPGGGRLPAVRHRKGGNQGYGMGGGGGQKRARHANWERTQQRQSEHFCGKGRWAQPHGHAERHVCWGSAAEGRATGGGGFVAWRKECPTNFRNQDIASNLRGNLQKKRVSATAK